MYPEVTEYLKKLEDYFSNLSLQDLNYVEQVLFDCWADGNEQGITDSRED
jgi:hypothetical protein